MLKWLRTDEPKNKEEEIDRNWMAVAMRRLDRLEIPSGALASTQKDGSKLRYSACLLRNWYVKKTYIPHFCDVLLNAFWIEGLAVIPWKHLATDQP